MTPNRRRIIALLCGAAITGTALVACSSDTTGDTSSRDAASSATTPATPPVAERYGTTPQVLADADLSGTDVSALFFTTAPAAIIAAPDPVSQQRAASIAVTTGLPMLTTTGANDTALATEIERLGATDILTVGATAPDLPDTPTVHTDDGTPAAFRALTGTAPEAVAPEHTPAGLLRQITALKPGDLIGPAAEQPTTGDTTDTAETGKLPTRDTDDNDRAPLVLAAPGTGIAAVATARAAGADVEILDHADPRISEHSVELVRNLDGGPVIALGQVFGTTEQFTRATELATTVTAEQPGGGQLVFPGRRMIAYYGHPSGGALGIMGERSPEESVAHLRDLVAQYAPLAEEPVIPAFEIIATVASASPGPDGDYSNEADPEELRPYIDAITEAGGYAVLDLQPGRARLIDQAKIYTDLLKLPNVGLALDAEWKLGPDEVPLQQVGHVQAEEVNEVADWLAELTADNNLPQKAFVLHQFQLQMIRDRENINLGHPELAFVLHADGHGSAGDKFATFDALRQDLDPRYFIAWKNFIDEDTPMFTPEQTMDIEPRPWFVSYQ
ncbi:MBL fold metallo-hydrolase [Corynebacterium sp. P7202]|uniref:MBL fold metallo-hydrolase n=1 Tax=Corynebacterium pygosceleis TaxID=2800406 RepID=A0A9Q4GLP8_9CORY|nr:MBL fold metallo-hydrolase [Corynebacterium pygosceleis]MCK7637859.1 MBL fold metallo-hydrolase [Corynebacterium pygosceleis]MCX7444601.1 MBL fold metallo-hydrolase [Corynebacterium pygosceleis]MCX7468575.1 MBL fold metallo-hydrolase [Corynebacterium pygosceleis]